MILTLRTVEIREVLMISVADCLKLQLVDQDQMDGNFDSLLCVSEALSSFVLQWIVEAAILFLPKCAFISTNGLINRKICLADVLLVLHLALLSMFANLSSLP